MTFQTPLFVADILERGGFESGFDARSLPPSRAKRSRSFAFRLLLVSGAGLTLAAAIMSGALDRASTGGAVPSAPSPPPPAWVELAPVPDMFRLDAPEFLREPSLREARRHRTGGGRQDMWIFGDAKGVSPFFRLMIYKVGDEIAPAATFFVDLARRAAEMGHAIAKFTQPAAMTTRFGNFEVADLNLIRTGAVETPCLGFRFAAEAPNLRITGFTCGGDASTGAKLMSRAALACLIDRLVLAAPTENREFDRLFARPSRRDPACGRGSPLAAR
ncbi:hypothetical protein [Methylocapsa palsarum]|uniref:Uncharacterized protein n=1 Tax=Methylocapsa palsarum TaxID=1612308 RepID=A0A1I4BGX0_9HYPH|nr:hypothetical protein [Methylocapsa palsarum]SFK68034.1 hypothetical protein SAMN05444581_1153 [Methylocapsa palsarum]